jgi:hypothetical protein
MIGKLQNITDGEVGGGRTVPVGGTGSRCRADVEPWLDLDLRAANTYDCLLEM